jgi:Mechanosensitive ion channel, conserved TM helix
MQPNVVNTLLESLNQGLSTTVAFLPNLIVGIIILLIGIVVAAFIKQLVIKILEALNVEKYLEKYNIPSADKGFGWVEIIAEIARWFIIILFLIPTSDVWQLPEVAILLNTFLLYLPNVFVAAIIGVVGLVFAKLAAEVVSASTKGFSSDASRIVTSTVRIAITIFVLLAVLNQLGVAQDLIRILFTGFVAMVALAGGIAFGLGGKDFAKALLDKLQKKLK